ncbi:MAG: CoA transferase, partial [Deltaproteobacteria bacterium]|nr:CoA transferase [Deltaproteobacteria bacterium]
LNGPLFMDLSANPKRVLPDGNRSDGFPAAPYGCYKCAGTDRWCVIAVFDDGEWRSLCRVMGQPGWSNEAKYSNVSKRKARSRELDKLIGRWTSKNKPETVMRLLQDQGVPAGIVQNAEDLSNDPQLQARDFFIHLEHPIFGDTISDGLPIKFRNTPTNPRKPAPLLGEDNTYVYMELLGLTEKELAGYMRKGVIA